MEKFSFSRIKKAAKAVEASESVPNVTSIEATSRTKEKIERLLSREPRVAELRASFDKLVAAEEVKMDVAARKARSGSLKRSIKQSRELTRSVERKIKDLRALPARLGNVDYYFLDTPFQITGFASESANLEPAGSQVKFDLDVRYGSRRLIRDTTFKFYWTNGDRYSVLDLHGYLVLKGTCEVRCGGGFLPGSRSAGFDMQHKVSVIDYSTYPYVGVLAQTPDVEVQKVGVSSDGFGGLGGIVRLEVFRGYDVDKRLVVVPPYQSIGLHMSVKTATGTGDDSGTVLADFSSGDFGVGCPGFLVARLS